jgi:hypothetical protein
MPNRLFCASGPGRRMRVDGPLYHIEQARWRHRPGNRGGRKPHTAQIASRQAGPSHKAPLNHIADLEHAANKACFGTSTQSPRYSVRARSSTATGQSTPDRVTEAVLCDRRDGCAVQGNPGTASGSAGSLRPPARTDPGPLSGTTGHAGRRASRSHVHHGPARQLVTRSPRPSRPADGEPGSWHNRRAPRPVTGRSWLR